MHPTYVLVALLWNACQQFPHTAELPGLVADGGSLPGARELAAFGGLVGSWDVDVAYPRLDGRVEHRPGEWHFAWILEGRAIQDVRRVTSADPAATPLSDGATISAWDPDLGAWRVSWVSGLSGATTSFVASAIGGEIVLESQGEAKVRRRIFSDITPMSFRWRALGTPDGGRTWVVEQELTARRRQAGSG